MRGVQAAVAGNSLARCGIVEQAHRQPLAIRLLDVLLALAFFTLTFLFGCFKQKDADIWWHLKTGQTIRDRHELPRTDWYTFTSAEREWIDLHWSFQVVAAALYELGGMESLTVASASLGVIALAIQLFGRRPGGSLAATVAVWTPFLILLSGRMYVRPEAVTLVILSYYVAVLLNARDHPGWLWSLPTRSRKPLPTPW